MFKIFFLFDFAKNEWGPPCLSTSFKINKDFKNFKNLNHNGRTEHYLVFLFQKFPKDLKYKHRPETEILLELI